MAALRLIYHGVFPPRSTRVRLNQRTDNEANEFTTEQIIGVLAEHETGVKCPDLCRKHGGLDDTFHARKTKLGGMEPSKAKQLEVLKAEPD